MEREAYEVIVEDGRLLYKESMSPINSTEESKSIFVLSTTRTLYVGKKKKGVFQHSSFLSGGATTAAGRLVARDGILEVLSCFSLTYESLTKMVLLVKYLFIGQGDTYHIDRIINPILFLSNTN